MIKSFEEFGSEMIFESSIKRIQKWIFDYEIALITAFRKKRENVKYEAGTKNDGKPDGDNYTHKENRERNRELCAALLRKGYGVTKVKSVYIENYGLANSILSDEESFLVVNIKNDPDFYNVLFKLSEYYNQDCFCHKNKNEMVGWLVGTNAANYPGYGERVRSGKFVTDIENEFMSRLGNKGFAFTVKQGNKGFETSHAKRKAERIQKRLERGIAEEFTFFENESISAKHCISLLGDPVLEKL